MIIISNNILGKCSKSELGAYECYNVTGNRPLPGAAPIEFFVGGQRHTAPSKKFDQNFCLRKKFDKKRG